VTKRPDIINLVRRGADISYLSNDEDEIQGSQNQILEKKNPMLAFLFKVRTLIKYLHFNLSPSFL